jgi:MFS family permease
MTQVAGPSGVPVRTVIVLMIAVFTVSMGFGIILPLLPFLIERFLGTGAQAVQMSRATGLLTAIYTLALFVFAPLWGRLSDKIGRRVILLVGLGGFALTMLVFSFVQRLSGLYVERFLSGFFAAAVTPVALSVIADLAVSDAARARRLPFVSIAGISGYLLGPMLGVLLSGVGGATGSIAVPLRATALLALIAALFIAIAVPGGAPRPSLEKRDRNLGEQDRGTIFRLLALAFVVAAAVGVFEVGLALRGKIDLGLTRAEIAWMFTECSLVMIVVQAIVFSPLIRPEATRWLIAPALAVLAVSLALVPFASNFPLMLAVIAAVAASAGILSPILTFWISNKARGATQGAAFGTQTAAASLGAATGAAAGGMLFDVTVLPNAAFVFVTVTTLIGVAISLGLPALLMPPIPRDPLPQP